MSDPINLPLLRERLALAHGMVSDLCKRQGEPGWRRWEMFIPANPSRDPDLVIAAGLDAGDALALEVERLTTRGDEDLGRMQRVVYDELCRAVKDALPDADLSRIDGAASDGDEFEFTAAEVSIATGMLTDEIGDLRDRVAELEQARAGDVARIVGWLRAKSSSRPAATGSNEAFGRGFGTALLDTANCIERGDWRDQPADLRPHSDRVYITPAVWRRMEAAGFVPGTENPVGWLVRTAEEIATLRAAARAVLSLTGDEPMEEADAALDALATAAGVPEGSST